MQLEDQVVVFCGNDNKHQIDPIFCQSKFFDSILQLKLPREEDIKNIINDHLDNIDLEMDEIVSIVKQSSFSFYEIISFFNFLKKHCNFCNNVINLKWREIMKI